ncbi:hypothetical protein E3N88_38196 [Mikania micrantha]|uniref:Uncharacterized protein n=1 Tax=Mikania micrantha TaxID=192012 RepID=A0A5N6LTD2_9ASTR|nr:hypothetical protein E3N88_38196 [Mikania micrantha]
MQQVKTRRWWYQGQSLVKALLILPSNVFALQETKKGDDLATLGLCFGAKDVFELGLDRTKNHHKRKYIFQDSIRGDGKLYDDLVAIIHAGDEEALAKQTRAPPRYGLLYSIKIQKIAIFRLVSVTTSFVAEEISMKMHLQVQPLTLTEKHDFFNATLKTMQ